MPETLPSRSFQNQRQSGHHKFNLRRAARHHLIRATSQVAKDSSLGRWRHDTSSDFVAHKNYRPTQFESHIQCFLELGEDRFLGALLHEQVRQPERDAIYQEEKTFAFNDLVSQIKAILNGMPMVWPAISVEGDALPHLFVSNLSRTGRKVSDRKPGSSRKRFGIQALPAPVCAQYELKERIHAVFSAENGYAASIAKALPTLRRWNIPP